MPSAVPVSASNEPVASKVTASGAGPDVLSAVARATGARLPST